MPSLSKLFKSAKFKLTEKRRKSNSGSSSSQSTGVKSVRFSDLNQDSIYYTHSSLEYDRKSLSTYASWDEHHSEADSLKSDFLDGEDDIVMFDEEVMRNTKVNKKQGYYSIAALVSYRSNI